MKEERKSALVTFVGVLFLCWVFTLGVAITFSDGAGSSQSGLVGDTFGALNALISILGFAAIVYTIQKEHDDDEEDEKRHEANLLLQKEILELQKSMAQAEAEREDTRQLASSLNIYSDLKRTAESDLQTCEDFLKSYGRFLLTAVEHGQKATFDETYNSSTNPPALMPMILAARRFRPEFNRGGNAHVEATTVLDIVLKRLNSCHDDARRYGFQASCVLQKLLERDGFAVSEPPTEPTQSSEAS